MKKIYKKGFTVVELLVILGVLILLVSIFLSTFVQFRKHQSLLMDTDTIVGVLRQARNQTLSSQNSVNYGVHITAPTVTLFVGPSYSAGAGNNQVFSLSSTDTIVNVALTGGGSDVIFNRLSGETAQNGSITVSSPGIPENKTVTIYKTGLVDSQ